ncbi:MAG: hypothetical protein KBA90_14745 [Chitinophagaceae bacterium]|nr:hypothetical protein [Chitinophagaceae bacterium]
MRTGTTSHDQCPICGNHTVDAEGDCKYAYCGDDEMGEREFMRSEGENRELTEDEILIYGL